MKTLIVWNAARTEGFATTDEQLAYEVRKSADSNCYHIDGEPSPVAREFCERWFPGTCTTQDVTAYDALVTALRLIATVGDTLDCQKFATGILNNCNITVDPKS